MINFVKFLIFAIVLCTTACSRTNYPEQLASRSLREYYFSSQANSQLALDIPANLEGESVAAVLPKGTDMTRLIPSYSLTGYALFIGDERQTSGESVTDFTGPVSCRLYSYDGVSTDYTINAIESAAYFESFVFTTANNSALTENIEGEISGNSVWFYLPHTYSLKKLTPDFTYEQENVTRDDVEQTSGSSMADFSSPLVYRVYAYDKTYMDYQVSAFRLTSLSFNEENNSFSGDYSAYLEDDTITVQLPADADLTSLVPSFSYLGDSLTFDGDTFESDSTPFDFSDSVSLTVSIDTGFSHTYTLIVQNAENPVNEENDPEYTDGSGTENGKTVTYNANGGTGAPTDSHTYAQGDTVTIPSTGPTRAGYEFNGWSLSSSGGAAYSAGGTITMGSADITLYAVWVDTTAPAQVTLGTTLSKGGSSFKINWTNPASDPTFKEVKITYSTNSSNIQSLISTGTSCTIGGGTSLLPLTKYTISLTSVDASGNTSGPLIFALSTGASGDPLVAYTTISTRSELEGISLSGNSILIADIDLSASGWTALGTLNGTFDGGGHIIKNLTISSTDEAAGLFKEISSSGTVQYLGLESVQISTSKSDPPVVTTDPDAGASAGALTAVNTGTITRCYAVGEVSGGQRVGGLIGFNSSSNPVSYSHASCKVTGYSYRANTGGFIGRNDGSGTVTMCYAEVSVNSDAIDSTTDEEYTGGFIGKMETGDIYKCFSTSKVTHTHNSGYTNAACTGGFIGGLAGGSIKECYSRGSVSGSDNTNTYSGGFAGFCKDAVITDSYECGTVDASSANSDPFLGYSDGVNSLSGNYFDYTNNSSSSSYATGKTTGDLTAGSFITASGWDFSGETASGTDDIWSIDPSGDNHINSGYPYLTGFSLPVTDVTLYSSNKLSLSWQDYSHSDIDISISPAVTSSTASTSGSIYTRTYSGISEKTEYTITLSAESGAVQRTIKLTTPSTLTDLSYTRVYAASPDLASIATTSNYLLMIDLNLTNFSTGTGWTPIGTFCGIFEGSGHKIYGLTIDDSSSSYLGLFSVLDGAAVYNLGIVGASVTGKTDTGILAGLATSNSNIQKCYNTGTVTVSNYNGGGIIGMMSVSSVLIKSYSEADVSGGYYIGGLVGHLDASEVKKSYSTGVVSGSTDIGGIAGINNGGTVENSYTVSKDSGSSYIEAVGSGSATNSFSGDSDIADMQTLSTYTDAGWDFSATWGISLYSNGGYPYLVENQP